MKKKTKTKSKHTIRVFVVHYPVGTVHLEYHDHNEDHPTEDSPGQPITLLPGEQVRWKSTSGAPILVHFKNGSPFDSKVTDLPKKPPSDVTEYETVKKDVPDPGGNNPDYKYTVTVQGVPPDDPDVIIDLTGVGAEKPKPKPKPKPKAKPKSKPKK